MAPRFGDVTLRGLMDPKKREGLAGLAFAVAAFASWGLAPIYFKALKSVHPVQLVAHRVIWSVLLLVVLIQFTRKWDAVWAAWADRKNRRVLALTAALISGNWLLFIWAANSGQLLQSSLGYFINPLLNVLLGVVFLGEILNRLQKLAVAIASIGVLNLLAAHGTFPWIALSLALSFGLYGLFRKKVPVDSTVGLFLETALMTPFALIYLAYLGWTGDLAFGQGDTRVDLLLASSGVITAIPLLWFVAGARRLKLATIGLVQYISPTGQFLLAVLLYGETFTRAHAVTFGLIWVSLAVYSLSAFWTKRSAPLSHTAPERG